MKWSTIPRPIVCLAPMDGITNTAYRQIVRKINPNLILFSEFTNVDGILRSEYVRKRLDYATCEHPFFMQLFGNNPESFKEVSKIVEDLGIMGVDINMGCPSKKIVASQHGSALMKDVKQACKIVEAIRQACSLDVSVKTRLGWENSEGLIPFAQSLESAGTSLITIHGRTYKQAYKGQANWEPIYELKEHLNIPVLGNGDLLHYLDGMQKMRNLDGFMIGRNAIGDPWVFQSPQVKKPSLSQRVALGIEHYHLLKEIKPSHVALKEFRKYVSGYLQGFPNAKEWRIRLTQTETEEAFLDVMHEVQSLSFADQTPASKVA